MIVVMTPERAIGRAGKMPWHLPEDLKRFRKLTTGHAVIMGRKTFESIGRALPGRKNIVVTRSNPALPEGVAKVTSLSDAISLARVEDEAPFVIGGGELYAAALPFATDLHVTLVEGVEVDKADTFFPPIDASAFEELERESATTPGLSFIHYRRRGFQQHP
jgi:dihydrofolate reductase